MDKLTQMEINVITETVYRKACKDVATAFAQRMREAVSEANLPFSGILYEKIDKIERELFK